MTDVAAETLTDLCKRLEAFETPRWAIEAVLDVELTTPLILDPCCGLGIISRVCADRGLLVQATDIENWYTHFPKLWQPGCVVWNDDFFAWQSDLSDTTVVMNPPFSMAEDFVDHARKLNARKIICFQRQAWRESTTRREWWEKNAPARVWVCGARATCWRFDLLGTEKAEKGGTPTSNAWYVWERGHKGAEVTSAIYPPSKSKRKAA